MLAKKLALNQLIAGPLNNGGFYCWVLGVDHVRGTAEDTGRGYWGDVKEKLVKEL